MYIDIFFTLRRDGFRWLITTTVALSLTIGFSSFSRADFVAVGDVSGTVNAGGGATGAIEIGVDNLGGVSGDGEQVFGGIGPLESASAIVGVDVDGIGAVTLTDFVSQWDISGDLTLGDAGQGFLSMGASATVNVSGDTILGAQATGQGIVDISGAAFPGARLRTTGNLTVGDLGSGTINLSTRGSLLSEADAFVGNQDGGNGTVTLSDLGTRWSVQGNLTVGNGSGSTAHGRVEISNDALLQTEGAVSVNSSGTIALLGGTLRTIPSTTVIANSGLIRGDGFIDGGITIVGAGELRNAGALVQNGSTVTNLREHLLVSGPVVNGGTIQSLGGAMEFEAAVTNDFEIIARDAEMHFRGGVSNETGGIVSIGGDTTLHGDLVNNGGSLFVLSGSESLLIGNLTFTGSSVLGLTAGPAAGTLDVTGTIMFDDTIIGLDYSAGVFPQAGDTYQIMQADGGISGMFSPTASVGGEIWDIINTGTTLIATNSGVVAIPVGADFNGDGEVNALDLIIWENNFGATGPIGSLDGLGDADGDGDVDGSDFFKIQQDFGITPPPPIAVVPEPSTLALALLTLVCCPRRRRLS